MYALLNTEQLALKFSAGAFVAIVDDLLIAEPNMGASEGDDEMIAVCDLLTGPCPSLRYRMLCGLWGRVSKVAVEIEGISMLVDDGDVWWKAVIELSQLLEYGFWVVGNTIGIAQNGDFERLKALGHVR